MIKLLMLSREGEVIPISYARESQLQVNAEKYTDIIFFFEEVIMENVWCVAEDMVEFSLTGRSEASILALAGEHPEVNVFFAELTPEGFLSSHLQPVQIN